MENCPHCGESLMQDARTCPGCGSDEQTGWSERARYDSLDLPDDEFSHEEFEREEFGGEKRIPRCIHWFWWLAALGLVLFLVVSWF